MNSNNRLIALLSIGLFLHPLLPGLGLQDLLQLTLTRILFITDLNPLMSSAIASYSGLIIAVLIFRWILNKLQKLDNQDLNIHWRLALITFICFYALWFSFPYFTNPFSEYWIKGYKVIAESHDLYTYGIIYPARVIGLIIGIVIIQKKVSTVTNIT